MALECTVTIIQSASKYNVTTQLQQTVCERFKGSLPIVIAVTLGLGLLLNALGDEQGWRWCGRLATLVGAVWVVMVVITSVGGAVLAMIPHAPRGQRRRDRVASRDAAE